MIDKRLQILYGLLIFVYVGMRILRDGMIVSIVGQEGTAIARIISLICVIGFVFLQKTILKHFSMNNIIKYLSFSFALCILAIYLKLIPDNHLRVDFLPNIFQKLINKTGILLFFLLSDLFAVFIVTNFWLLCNSISVKTMQFNRLFSISQIGVVGASISGMFFEFKTLPILVIALAVIGLLITTLPKTFLSESKSTKTTININRSVFLVPTLTILCCIIAGFYDPYVKFQIQQSVANHQIYIQKIATIWLGQSIVCLVFNELINFNNKYQRFFAPLFLIILFLFLIIFRDVFSIGIYANVCAAGVIIFKALKYSTHSPEKEKYIQQSEEMYSILFFEGFAGRFGKNLAAIILVGLFSFGYTWKYISNYVLFILLFCSFAWLFLVNYLKIKKQ